MVTGTLRKPQAGIRRLLPRCLPDNWSATLLSLLLAAMLAVPVFATTASPREFEPVTPDRKLSFPRDFGAHPGFRTELW